MCAGSSYGCADDGGLVAAEVVHDDHVAWRQCRHEDPFDIGPERIAVDRAVDHPRCLDPVVAQGCDERRGVPVAEGGIALQPRAARSPAAQRCHVGLGPGFVNEHQPTRIDTGLMFLPPGPLSRDIRAGLLLSQRGFFLKLNPVARK